MKLQKQLSRKVGRKKYVKWVLVLPPNKIKGMGWKEGQEFDMLSYGEEIIIKPKKTKG